MADSIFSSKTDASSKVIPQNAGSAASSQMRGKSGGSSAAASAESRPAVPAQSQTFSLCPGKIYWGVCGHMEQGGAYTAISVAQQARDLKNIFGSTPNTILYRAFGTETKGIYTYIQQFQAQGIIPVVVCLAYPEWNTFTSTESAYEYAYYYMAGMAKSMPDVPIYEIGNEWTTSSPIKTQLNGSTVIASTWRACASYPLYLAVAAGAVAGIRDYSSAKILGGSLNGWLGQGLAVALENDLENYRTPNGKVRNLSWDFTVEHWYQDAYTGGDTNTMGMPDNFNGGMNAYTQLAAANKPVFFTEFGSSNNSSTANDSTAASDIVKLLDNIFAHRNATATENGVVGGIIYELYRQPNLSSKEAGYYLYDWSGGSSASPAKTGEAVKSWMSSHGNPAS